MNLQTSVALRVALVAAVTSVGIAYASVSRQAQQNHDEVTRVAHVASRHVGFQLVKLATGMDPGSIFPDWQPLADHINLQGLCVAYRDDAGRRTDRQCIPAELGLRPAPEWFAFVARHSIDFDAASAFPVGYFGFAEGRVVVFPEPEAALGKLWNQSRPMLQLLATEVLLVSILAWFAVASALRPTRQMLGCLAQMAQGDLAIRLPPARITELNSIVHAVNHLSSKLHATLLERAALAHRLVDAHESERRNLARELHDELAQCLSAINAKAALIALHAARSAPIVISQAKSIGEVATSTLGQLRDTLVRLRPPEIDELGLIESLERMVRCWGRNHPEIECRFEASGCFDAVPMPASVSLYRIVQECLTNVARHADASHVTVMLGRSPKGPLDLQVLDDGCGMAPAEPQSGLGVVGMRERVAALQGRIRFASGRSKGFTVHVTLPTEYESPLTAVDARAVGT